MEMPIGDIYRWISSAESVMKSSDSISGPMTTELYDMYTNTLKRFNGELDRRNRLMFNRLKGVERNAP